MRTETAAAAIVVLTASFTVGASSIGAFAFAWSTDSTSL